MKTIAREFIKIDDKQWKKELDKTVTNLNYFTDRALHVGFNISLDNHHINHSNSKTNLKHNFPEIEIQFEHNKILKEMATNYARLINQY